MAWRRPRACLNDLELSEGKVMSLRSCRGPMLARVGIQSVLTLACAVVALLAVVPASPGETQDAATRQYNEQIRPFLARHCLECHGTEKPKGDLRLDRLSPDFAGE